jgi:hypothetical protein
VRNPNAFLVVSLALLFKPSTGPAEMCPRARNQFIKSGRCARHMLLANDLKLISATDYTDLAQQTSEVKRMLTGLLQKLIADR